MHPEVDTQACTGCGTCASVCPAEPIAVFEIEDIAKVVHPEACIECGNCVQNCPVEAIVLID